MKMKKKELFDLTFGPSLPCPHPVPWPPPAAAGNTPAPAQSAPRSQSPGNGSAPAPPQDRPTHPGIRRQQQHANSNRTISKGSQRFKTTC